MTTSIIDGRVEAADLKRTKGGVSVFRSLTFQPDAGPTRTIKNAVVKDNVASELVPGTAGRFYIYNAFDLKGVHGVRTRDGRATYGFATNNKKIFLIVGIVNIAWIALRVFVIDGQVPLLAILLMILSVAGFTFMSKGEKDAKAQFDGDAGYAPPA